MTNEPTHSCRLRLCHLYPRERGAGVARPDGRRPDGALLGTRQRLGLAAGLDLGAPAPRRIRRVDVVGRVVKAEPPTRLVITFDDAPDAGSPREPSVVTFLVEPHQDIVRLTVTHENLPNQEMLNGISHGWPAVLANLKSLLETGDVLPQAPWEMSPAHA